jgi:integrase
VPRPSTGEVVVRNGRNGRRTFALRLRAYGERRYPTLGTADQGWSRQRAQAELANVMADVRRGIWRPPEAAAPAPADAVQPSFHEFASEWFEGKRLEGLAQNSVTDYEWQLSNHLLPFFAEHRLSEITVAEVDRYRQAKVGEGELGATSINKTIARLAQILDVALERELIARNPARGRRRRLKQRQPERTFLDRAEQIAALLDAAGELDREARVDHRATPRRVVLAALVLGGLRIGEALALRWRDVDLAAGRLHVGRAKTDAGVRHVDLLPALREDLTGHRAGTAFAKPTDPVFPTERGRPQNPSNIRNRLLARSVQRANERLAAREAAPLPDGLTPHSLRRTYISLLFALGAEVPYVMRQVGHTDPKVTLSIYAQVMYRGPGETERLRALVNGSPVNGIHVDGAPAPNCPTPNPSSNLSEWAPMGTNDPNDSSPPVPARPDQPPISLENRPPGNGRGWFRTSDLSRVKRALSH